MNRKLPSDFFLSEYVVQLSKALLGKYLFTRFDNKLTGGIIIETEAYAGITDRASHAFGGRKTARTEVMYRKGGIAYVYLCYGIHSLFNVVTNQEGVPHAVLIRALHPVTGITHMRERIKGEQDNTALTSGPGKLSKALGISIAHTGISLRGNSIWIEDRGCAIPDKEIIAGPRIGVAYAGNDALLPYRFTLKNNAAVQKALS